MQHNILDRSTTSIDFGITRTNSYRRDSMPLNGADARSARNARRRINRAQPSRRTCTAEDEIIDGFHRLWREEKYDRALFERFFSSVQVQSRHLALPIDDYPKVARDSPRRIAYLQEVGTGLAERAVRDALAGGGAASAKDVDAICSLRPLPACPYRPSTPC